MNKQVQPDSLFRVDDLLVDTATRTVARVGTEIPMARLTFTMLETLIRAAPRIVSLDELMQTVWGDVVVSEETLTQRISLLRQALGDSSKSPRYIKSVRGVGYRLIPEVTGEVAAKAPAGKPKKAGVLGLAIGAGIVGAVVVSLLLVLRMGEPVETRDKISVAVLPFDDMSVNGDQGYFADGMHEEIISRLAQLSAFSVVSRTSVMPYRDSAKSLGEIGAELQADVILEGSVRRSGDTVRITAQLVDAQKDSHYFSETFEKPLTVDNIFAIQSEVAKSIADQLSASLSERDGAKLAYLPTENLAAYNDLLLGRYHLWRGNPEDLRRAIAFFEAAIDADPDLAEAHAGLARAYTFVGSTYGWMEPAEALALAEPATLRALELNSDLVEAQVVYGDLLTWYRWDWAGAEAAYRRAQESGNNDAGLSYLLLLSSQGRAEETIVLAEALEERYPQDHWVRSNLGWGYLNIGDVNAAISQANAALAIDDSYGDAFAIRGVAHWRMGDTDMAIKDFEKNVELQSRSPWSLALLAMAYVDAEQIAPAYALLSELQERAIQSYVPGESIAAIHVSLGNDDEALRWLNAAFDQRSRGLIFLKVHRVWDGLRGHPEFQSLLVRVGLD